LLLQTTKASGLVLVALTAASTGLRETFFSLKRQTHLASLFPPLFVTTPFLNFLF